MEQREYCELMQIKKCKVISRTGDTYFLSLKLINGRSSRYFFRKGEDVITWNKRIYHLPPEAQKTLCDEVSSFDNRVEGMQKGGDGIITAEYPSPDVIVHIKLRDMPSDIQYDVLFEFDAHTEKTLLYKPQTNMLFIMESMQKRYADRADEKTHELLFPNVQALHGNPLYIAAEKGNNLFIQSVLEGLYGSFTKKDFILPDVSEEYDREYYVITETLVMINVSRSGYVAIHRPCFAMRGFTHAVCTVNPYKKSIVDAAPKDAKRITFLEFVNELASGQ